MRTYGRTACHLCRQGVSVGGLARVSHMRAHVRRGEAVEFHSPEGARFFSPAEAAQIDQNLPRGWRRAPKREK